jgi:L-aminopeptidase/D-esterase-like protein
MRRSWTLAVVLVFPGLGARAIAAQPAPAATLTAIPGIKVGHYTLAERPTGCTVILTEAGAVAGVDVRGAAPGTRETDLLNPVNSIQQVHAIVLAGGSAFGLDAASGVMRYLDERNVGFKVDLWRDQVGPVNVPIVPSAILIDLGVGGSPKIRPTAECGYAAAQSATTGAVAEGNVGAGAGATVGKFAGAARAMKGGLGSAALTTPDGLIVAALVAVNAFGDIVDPGTGRVIAGVRTPDGRALADVRVLMQRGGSPRASVGGNSTIGVVATNAALTKTQAAKVAQMAHDGYARTIVPVHTPADGDTIFALATAAKSGDADVLRIGALAADVMSTAILRAIREARSIPGYPAARELQR